MNSPNIISIIKEFKISHKEFFETKFALSILENSSDFTSVKKVSEAIVALLTAHKTLVLEILAKNDKIKEELFDEKYFAHFDANKVNSSSPQDIYQLLLDSLTAKEIQLEKVIHIHVIFIQKIYDHIIKDDVTQLTRKEQLVQKIFYNHLFTQRGRIYNNSKPSLTNQIGISRNKFFAGKISEDRGKHIPAFLCFSKDNNSPYVKALEAYDTPFVAGPSGHTGSLLLGASLYGNLKLEELHNYVLACFAYLTCGGNHSFHEVMVVANTLNIPYLPGDYLMSLPDHFKRTTAFEQLAEEFPQYLEEKMDNHKMMLAPLPIAGI